VQSSAALTEWKKTEELAFLTEVSSVPLQQALRHLQTAFANFFAKRAQNMAGCLSSSGLRSLGAWLSWGADRRGALPP
jgi:hypothetical protein